MQVTHPDDQTLKAYGLGKLVDEQASTVNDHLESCADCRQRASGLSSDSFLGRLREGQQPTERSVGGGSLVEGTLSFIQAKAPALPPATDTLPPGLASHPDYEIKRELGRGGMGVVYLAHNTMMGRDEVLKVMGRNIMERPGVLERFQREIRAVAKLRHPNIVGAHSAFRIEGGLVFAMEYVEGLDLSRLVKAKGPLSVSYASYFIHQAALGLQHAHEKGLIHRDIKPHNLMLTHDGKARLVKVLDFGLAKATREERVDGGLTSEGQALGTPDFIAPEQIVNALDVDIRADLYSLGGTLFYLLTGRPPFQCTSLYDIYQAHMSRDAEPLNLIRPEIPSELAALVAKMMAKDPARRFQTPAEVAICLMPFFKRTTLVPGKMAPNLSEAGRSPIQPTTPFDASEVRDRVGGSTEPATPGRKSVGVTRSHPEAVPVAPEPVPAEDATPRWHRRFVAAAVAGVVCLLGIVIILRWERDKVSLTVARTPEPTGERQGRQPQSGSPPVIWSEPGAQSAKGNRGPAKPASSADVPLVLEPPADPPVDEKAPADAAKGESVPGDRPDTPAEGAARRQGHKPADFVNTLGMEFMKIPAGEFVMGSPDSDLQADEIEKPQRRVKFDRPFLMGRYEVTQKEFRQLMDVDASYDYLGDDLPADPGIHGHWWTEAVRFCNLLSEREGLRPYYRLGRFSEAGGDGYRLPTNAEWEYACRAGTTTRYPFGDKPQRLGEFAWFKDNAQDKLHPVGQWKPNPWGLYDMLGNAWELCSDLPETRRQSPSNPIPMADDLGPLRRRGGATNVEASRCRFAHLSTCFDCSGYRSVEGLRLVRELPSGDPSPAIVVPKRAEAKANTAVAPPELIPNTIGMNFSVIPAGKFTMGSPDMGSPEADLYAQINEMPQREVTISKPFRLGTTEVTVEQYRRLMNEVPYPDGMNKDGDLPVVGITWKQAVDFCNQLSELEGIKPYYRFGKVAVSGGVGYRLPTEAEWEYACRAGSRSRFPFGDDKAKADAYIWHAGNSGGKLRPVGLLKPNAWGLQDMLGNAWEMCADVLEERPSVSEPIPKPIDLSFSASRASRGGSFQESGWFDRSASRNGAHWHDIGFRVARDHVPEKVSTPATAPKAPPK